MQRQQGGDHVRTCRIQCTYELEHVGVDEGKREVRNCAEISLQIWNQTNTRQFCISLVFLPEVEMILAISPSWSQLFSLYLCHHHQPQVWQLLFFLPFSPVKAETAVSIMQNCASLDKNSNSTAGPLILGEFLSWLT